MLQKMLCKMLQGSIQMNAVLKLMEEFLASVSLIKRQQVVATLTKAYTT